MHQFRPFVQDRHDLAAARGELVHHLDEEPGEPRGLDEQDVLGVVGGIGRRRVAARFTQPQQHAQTEQSEHQQHQVQDRDRPRRVIQPREHEGRDRGQCRDQHARLREFERVADRIKPRDRRTGLKPLKDEQRSNQRDRAIGGDADGPNQRAIAQEKGGNRTEAAPCNFPQRHTRQQSRVRGRHFPAQV